MRTAALYASGHFVGRWTLQRRPYAAGSLLDLPKSQDYYQSAYSCGLKCCPVSLSPVIMTNCSWIASLGCFGAAMPKTIGKPHAMVFSQIDPRQ